MINKKLLFGVTILVILIILGLLILLRHSPLGQNYVTGPIIAYTLVLFALPMRLYVILIRGENSSWPFWQFILFLVLSGLMWGFIVERVTYLLGKKKNKSVEPAA